VKTPGTKWRGAARFKNFVACTRAEENTTGHLGAIQSAFPNVASRILRRRDEVASLNDGAKSGSPPGAVPLRSWRSRRLSLRLLDPGSWLLFSSAVKAQNGRGHNKKPAGQ
jgi:hypothetical protein